MMQHVSRLPTPEPRFPMAKAVKIIADRHGLDSADIMGRSRRPSIAHARQEVFWLARQDGLSFAEIADYFGMDHTTVFYGVKKVDQRIAQGSNN